MPFVFLATQSVTQRHNEGVGDRHRSRVAISKGVSSSSKALKASPATQSSALDGLPLPSQLYEIPCGGELIVPSPSGDGVTPSYADDVVAFSDADDLSISSDDDVTDVEDDYQNWSTERRAIPTTGALSNEHRAIPTTGALYLSDEALNEEEFCNNNNDQLHNLNNKLSQSLCRNIGVPVEHFPPSLIKWPLDSSSKSRRLAVIRKQVKQLSRHIKMTIDSDQVEASMGEIRINPSPFSSHVNMSLLQGHLDTPSDLPLPGIEDFMAFLTTGKLKEAKGMVRESAWGINHPVRETLWKELAQTNIKEEFNDLYYWDTVQQIYGSKEISECNVVLPSLVDRQQMASHALSEEGVKRCHRVLAVISYSFPAITHAPILYSLASVFLHYMNEPEVYNCMSALLAKSSSYITQTKILNEAMWRTVLALARKHVRGSLVTLQKYGIADEQINEGFRHWSRWVFCYLPVTHLVRVIDCFLLEGSKVLLRCSLALFHMFMKNTARDPNLVTSLITKGFTETITCYCRNISCSPGKLLKTAFGIRALSKNAIKKIIAQSEVTFKSQSNLGGSSGFPEGVLVRSSSLEGLPTSESQKHIQMQSHTLGIKEEASRPHIQLPQIKSAVVVQDELLTIWGWLPMRMTMQHPTLVYTTEEHGSSLSTFHNRVDIHEPTLILVRTTSDYIFGAYCSTAWGERHHKDVYGHRQTYFGTGETFLFTLRPKPAKYEWVGIEKQRQDAALSTVSRSEELFLHADEDIIAVGGGSGHGLMLHREFQTGRTETCETFNNPPLCPDINFQIKVIEVYGLSQN